MSWPTATDYNEAIQNPQVCFADADLRAGHADGLMGLPQPFSGNFADVYKLLGGDGKNWAVKCFTREVQGLQARYQAISDHLQERSRPFMVEFQYLENGIKVKGAWFPVVKMSWVEGFALNQFVADHADESSVLERLGELWLKLAVQLREARMAHGDLQHGNVLLVPGSRANALALKLIDYDGMFVPALAHRPSGELGHRNYQHPQRKDSDAYHREMDRFSNLAIYTALRGVCLAGGLWSKYGDTENLLFRQQDFAEPAGSTLLKEMWLLPDRDARALTGHLVMASAGPLSEVPLLSDLVANGAVLPLGKDDEARVEGLLFARPAFARKSGFEPDAGGNGSRRDSAVPVLPSPLQPGDARRRTPFPAPSLPETVPLLKAVPVPPPLPAESLPPPLPLLVAVPVPPPLPVSVAETAAAAHAAQRTTRMPELLPVPLAALRGAESSPDLRAIPFAAVAAAEPLPAGSTQPSPRSGKFDARKQRDEDSDDPNFLRDHPALVWGAAGTLAAMLIGLLAWGLWPAKRATRADTPSLSPQIRQVRDIDLVGGDTAVATVSIDRRKNTAPLVLKTAGLPPGVAGPGDVVLPTNSEEAQLTFTADPSVDDGGFPVTVSLWSDKEKVDQSTAWLTLHKRPMPRLVNLKRLVWKVGETRDVDFEVDRQGNKDPLSLDILGCPPGVTFKVDPSDGRGLPLPLDEPPPLASFIRVRFFVAQDAMPGEDFVTLRLFAGPLPVLPEATVKYTLEKTALLPHLILGPRLPLLQRGTTELPVRVDRQGYVGPIKLQIQNLPDGVKCPPGAVIPEDKTFIRLEFQTDGTSPEGLCTVAVVALAGEQVADRKSLDLIIPKAPPPPIDPDPVDSRPGTVTLRTADDVLLRGTFLPGEKDKRSKCVLLLHDVGQSRNEPNLVHLAEALNAEGCSVLAIDFRGHGDSTRVGPAFGKFAHNRDVIVGRRLGIRGLPGEDVAGTIFFRNFPPAYYVHLVNDVAAAKAFLDDKDQAGQVDAANLVVIGIGDGTSIGALWLAAESHRYRPADPNGLVPGGKYAPVPEVRHVAGAVWINFRVTIASVDRTAAMAEWLRVAGRVHQIPMTFLYGRSDLLGKRNATNAVGALAPGPRWTQAITLPTEVLSPSHDLLSEGQGAEKVVLRMVKLLLDRTDGAIQLPRPPGGPSWWVFGNTAVLARQAGERTFQPVPVERFGITR
jgi:pimeloyl-ACP methyl ester carboxylesterase